MEVVSYWAGQISELLIRNSSLPFAKTPSPVAPLSFAKSPRIHLPLSRVRSPRRNLLSVALFLFARNSKRRTPSPQYQFDAALDDASNLLNLGIFIPARVFIQLQSCNTRRALLTMKMRRKRRIRHIKAFTGFWAFISCHVCGFMAAVTSNLSDVSVIVDEWCRAYAFSWIEYKPWKPKLLWLLVSSWHFNLFLSLAGKKKKKI